MPANGKTRFFNKNWRGQYKARNNYRGRGSRRGRGGPSNNNDSSMNSTANSTCTSTTSTSDGSFTFSSNDTFSSQTSTSSSSVPHDYAKKKCSPYAGWKLYFPDDEYKTSAEIVRKVKAAEEFIASLKEFFNAEEVEENRAYVFDLKMCYASNELLDRWPSFREDLCDNPSNTLDCLGLAVHQVVWKSLKEQSILLQDDDKPSIDIPLIKARISNYDTITPLKNLKTNFYGKLVSINGTVIRVGNTKLLCSWMAFQCCGCSTIQCVKQPDGEFTQPTKCLNKDCHTRTFVPLRSSPYTQTFDWQRVKVQELVPNDQREGGRVPRTIECELSDDLVSTCTPGDIVKISGIVKVRSTEENFKKAKGPSMYTLYIEVVNVTNNKTMDSAAGNPNADSGLSLQFTQRDYDAIQEIHSEPDLLKLLVNSLCPTIYGHEMVKAGLLLALFGGADTDSMESRGQIHVLVVGDPGLGKSQMLQACSYVAPRGVFVCGNTTTSSGLTVTLVREGSDFSLEAGALVLADQGCCCIDEFDKMSTQHQALLEVMEQRTVSIAKAGVICMLPARTTVLAAANPVGGHYDKGKTVSENLRMGQALLSRFDLVFILLDKPNELLDSLLSEHVMKIHLGTPTDLNNTFVKGRTQTVEAAGENIPLSERLRMSQNDQLDLLPTPLLRKYIAYARKYVKTPVLSKEARDVLQEFYSKMRENHHTMDSTPVTTRQLLSLVRLTQARAKLELREEATLSDAKEVIELINWSMIDTYSDENGSIDFQRSQHGSGISSKNQAKRFLTFMHRKAESLSRSTFSVSELKDFAALANVNVDNFSSFLSTLNTQGFILQKGRQTYQILSAD